MFLFCGNIECGFGEMGNKPRLLIWERRLVPFLRNYGEVNKWKRNKLNEDIKKEQAKFQNNPNMDTDISKASKLRGRMRRSNSKASKPGRGE